MGIFEFLSELLELFLSWRFYLCIAIGLIIAYFFHSIFPGAVWPWFISVPGIISSLIIGWRWQTAHDQKET